MDSIDREFEQLPLPAPRSSSHTPHSRFGRMVVLSCLLHLVSTAVVLSPRLPSPNSPVSYIDLADLKLPEDVKQAAPPAEPERKQDPAPAEPEIPAALPEMKQSLETTEPRSEMEQLQHDVKQSIMAAEANAEALHQRSFGLGLTNGHFSSLAQGETLRGDIREYYFEMLRQINEKWWRAKGPEGGAREVIINVVIARDGAVLEKMLLRSSGNPALDRVMLQTIDAASPLPPLPPTYTSEVFSVPLKFVRPLGLFISP